MAKDTVGEAQVSQVLTRARAGRTVQGGAYMGCGPQETALLPDSQVTSQPGGSFWSWPDRALSGFCCPVLCVLRLSLDLSEPEISSEKQ